MQQYDFEIIHRKGALNHFPDALSRIYEDQTVEVEAFEEVADLWYIKMLEVVEKFPIKYRGWKIENGQLYRYRIDQLLDPVVNREKVWRLVMPS